MITQLAHVCIGAHDLEETRRFYTEVLGLETAFEFEKEGALYGYYLKLGHGTFIEVFAADPHEEGKIQHLALEVEALDEFLTRIRKCGYEIADKKLGSDQSWQTWITDPNGVRIEFHEYTPQSSQRTGVTCCIR